MEMEDALNPAFASKTFGEIGRFMLVIVAVDSDSSENNRFVTGHTKIGSYKHPITSERVKFISLAVPFDPMILEPASPARRRQLVSDALMERLDNPPVKIPNSFNYERFVHEMRLALESYLKKNGER